MQKRKINFNHLLRLVLVIELILWSFISIFLTISLNTKINPQINFITEIQKHNTVFIAAFALSLITLITALSGLMRDKYRFNRNIDKCFFYLRISTAFIMLTIIIIQTKLLFA